MLASLLLAAAIASNPWVCSSAPAANEPKCDEKPAASLSAPQKADVSFRWRVDAHNLLAGFLQAGERLPDDWRKGSARISLEAASTDWPAPVILTLKNESTQKEWRLELAKGDAADLRAIHLGEGSYQLTAQAEGFASTATSVRIKPGSTNAIGRLKLIPIPQLRGGVIDKVTKTPVRGVAVRALDGKVHALTDYDGKFHVARSAVTGKIELVAPGYGSRFVTVPEGTADLELPVIQLSQGATMRVEIGAEMLHESLELELTQTDSGFERVRKESITKPGTVLWDSIEPGAYIVKASGPGPLQQIARTVELKSGEDREVRFEIKRTNIRFITRQSDRPAPGTRISVSKQEMRAKFDSGAEGDRTEEMWQEGEFLVLITAKGATTPQPNIKTVTAGHDETWRFDLPSGKITGRVVDADKGTPLADARLALRADADAEGIDSVWSAKSDATGGFEFNGLQPGTYSVTATSEQYADSDPLRVVISKDADVPPIIIRLTRAASQAVSVVDSSGTPMPGVEIFATTADGAVRSRTRSGPDGNADVSTPSGSHAFIAFSMGGQLGIAPVQAGSSQTILRLVQPTAALQVKTALKDRSPLRDVTFRVRYNGQALPGEILGRIERLQGSAFATDAAGQASLRGVPPGYYELWPLSARATTTDPVSVTAGPGVTVVEIVLTP